MVRLELGKSPNSVWKVEATDAHTGYVAGETRFLLCEGMTIYVNQLYVDESYRQQGIATKMLTLLIETFINYAIELNVKIGNTKAQSLYRKMGFVFLPTRERGSSHLPMRRDAHVG